MSKEKSKIDEFDTSENTTRKKELLQNQGLEYFGGGIWWHPTKTRFSRNRVIEFWDGVLKTPDDDNECWLWKTAKEKTYGVWHRAHAQRRAWELTNGPIPKGMHVLHKCDNPPCVRPSHLFLGTPKDNVTDMIQKGRKKGRIFTQEQIDDIRKRFAGYPGNVSTFIHSMCMEYNAAPITISHIVYGHTHKQKLPKPTRTTPVRKYRKKPRNVEYQQIPLEA